MKKNYSLALLAAALMFLGTVKSFAAEYTISFTGSGKSTTVESVLVQNLTQGTSVTVPGGDALVLSVILTGLDPQSMAKAGLRISSNSVPGRSDVTFFAQQAGNTQINVYGMDGRKILGSSRNLQKGDNSFQVSLPSGAYVINVRGAAFSYSGKLISAVSLNSQPEIAFVKFEERKTITSLKSSNVTTTMDYYPGDILLYKGISGNYATIVTDVPTGSKTTNFDFVECKDGSGNYYAVVKIGDQVWMAENIKTTKYINNVDIAIASDATAWVNAGNALAGAYCEYDNNAGNAATYGKLYNWYAANDTVNVFAPVGWHVADDAEWTILSDFCGGLSLAGGNLKQTGTSLWASPNTGATNSTGFTALPGGTRLDDGTFEQIANQSQWWTSTLNSTNYYYYRRLGSDNSEVYRSDRTSLNGMYARCVKNTPSTLKSISFYADWAGGTEMWDFTYDPTSKLITQFDNYWDGSPDKTVTYDYSVPGKLTLMKDGTSEYGDFDINDQGKVVIDNGSGDEYEYDASGFLSKTYETWSGSKVLHNEMTITDGNITKITTYDDDGVTVKKIKEFTYTSRDNADSIHQANAIDNDWKPMGNFYGKPSAKLLDYFEYWDPRVIPIVKNKSIYTYIFDTKNRVAKAVKTLQDTSTEEWSYTYYK